MGGIARMLIAVAALPTMAAAQAASDSLALTGRSVIAIGAGLTGTRSATEAPGTSTTISTGQLGSFGFAHWIAPELGIEVVTGLLNANDVASAGRDRSDAIFPILFGVQYAPRALTIGRSVRPYLAAAAGPYVHADANVGGGSTSSFTETAPGGRIAVGAHWFVARHFELGVEGDYHAVGHFAHVDAVSEHPSGAGLLVTFGFAWGGR